MTNVRSGSDGPVDAADLAAAHGSDDPRVIARYQAQLDTDGAQVAVAEALSTDRIKVNDVARHCSHGFPMDHPRYYCATPALHGND